MFKSPMWITPLPPLLSASGVGSHGSVLSENYAPNRLTSACKSTAGHHGAGGADRARGDLTTHERGLAVAKSRGVNLGNPNGAESLRRAGKGAVALREAVSANADRFAEGLVPVLADIRVQGHVTLPAVAAELNRRGMMTRRGGIWQVSNVVQRGSQPLSTRNARSDVSNDDQTGPQPRHPEVLSGLPSSIV